MTKAFKSIIYKIRIYLEAIGFRFICFLFQSLSLKDASCLGGWIGRNLGPWFPVTRTAYRNLSIVFPHLTYSEKKQIIKSMWQEWGQVAAEYCHLPTFLDNPSLCTVEGYEVLEDLEGQPAILFTAHLSHFQMIAIAAYRRGLPLVQFYRKANNPFVDRGMYAYQSQVAKKVITKGLKGLKEVIQALKENERVLMLIDQKFHQGLLIPFLGHLALTSSSVATLSRRLRCPLVPVRVERTAPLHFHITFYPPVSLRGSDEDIMTRINDQIGQWIQERPEQWFWVHKRWPFSSTK